VTIEHRLRNALAEYDTTVAMPPDRWEEVATGARRRSRLRNSALSALGVAAAAAVVAFVAVPALRLAPARRVVTTPLVSPTSLPSSIGTPVPTTLTPSVPYRFGYQPLWPFRTQQEAHDWQQSYRAGGHQPWHLDADQTALSFTEGYLGYTDIDRVTRHVVGAVDAHVAVGYVTTGSRTVVAAVIHLARFGTGSDAPWEIVGTDDTPDFTLELPRYGATVASPASVGGRVSGVDESIRVEVHQPTSSARLGASCCLPAGGTDSPWKTEVSFAGAGDPVLTISASTGGHLQSVERFAVTGVRPSGSQTQHG
jgi:hypothetical protein